MTISSVVAPSATRVRAIVLRDPGGHGAALARSLEQNGFNYTTAADASEAVTLAEASRPALLIVSESDLAAAPALGIGLPGRRTLVITESDTWETEATGVAAVLAGHALNDEEAVGTALHIGAQEAAVSRRKETMLRWLERESERDSLTGLHNRQAFEDALAAACRDASEHRQPVAVIVVDVLGTRMVNETYGHEAGNELIKRAAGGVLHSIRGSDVAARLGGDDFGVVLPGASIDVARHVARRILHHMEELNETEWADEIPVTVAFGVASGTGCTADELLSAATARIVPHHHLIMTRQPNRLADDGPSVA